MARQTGIERVRLSWTSRTSFHDIRIDGYRISIGTEIINDRIPTEESFREIQQHPGVVKFRLFGYQLGMINVDFILEEVNATVRSEES